MPPRAKKARTVNEVRDGAPKKGKSATAAVNTAHARAIQKYKLLPAATKSKQRTITCRRHRMRPRGSGTSRCGTRPRRRLRHRGRRVLHGPGRRARPRGGCAGGDAPAQQRAGLLLRSTLVTQAGVDYAESDDVRGLEVRGRVFSADGPNVVDVYHYFHRRTRGYGHELFADVKVAIACPAGEAPAVKSSAWRELWKRYKEERDWGLDASDIDEIRGALFTGEAASRRWARAPGRAWARAPGGGRAGARACANTYMKM
ncbi:MAG: hypothetical protein J3K34DRAFT_423687 [Monoraphidium minutum]|nr:MAG: hypothetical protein J3K34DRAFT_423687 [Monoraphidium minutum]